MVKVMGINRVLILSVVLQYSYKTNTAILIQQEICTKHTQTPFSMTQAKKIFTQVKTKTIVEMPLFSTCLSSVISFSHQHSSRAMLLGKCHCQSLDLCGHVR